MKRGRNFRLKSDMPLLAGEAPISFDATGRFSFSM
jgi:hypothetical protein